VLARTLASFGGSVRVEGPPEVRSRLRTLAEEILAGQVPALKVTAH